MKISKAKAVKLLKECGHEKADSWNDKKLLAKLIALPENMDEDTEPESNVCKDTLEALIAAQENEEEITLEGSDDEDEKPKKGKKKDKEGKKEKKKEKKESAATDRFGSREGTKAAALNAVLSSKAKTMAELVKEAKLDEGASYYNHMKKLIEAGHIVHTDEGFKIKGEKKKK